ncbi:MAG: hypothetical protein JRJ69_18305 [Deltaproteobacteria bacterium]|nr:hypothetical protein [Deltaproteobacteria bacterium]
MGLDCSHNAFSGAYSAFNRFRQAVAKAANGSFPPHDPKNNLDDRYWYFGEGYSKDTHPGLYIFLSHSDCDGEISPEDCKKVADELEELLPKLDAMGKGKGHIFLVGGYGNVCRKFIAGCRLAAEKNEPLEFY